MQEYKTTGEVAKEIGISTRKLKYYREQGYFVPSKIEIHGNKTICYYDLDDIQRLSQVKLYKELGYTTNQIKDILEEKDFDRKLILNNQIKELRKQKKHIQNLLIAAEFMNMLYADEDENVFSLQDFDGNIDLFASGMYGMFSDDGEKNIEQATLQLSSTFNQKFTLENIKQLEKDGDILITIFQRIRKIVQNYDKNNNYSKEFSACVNDLLKLYSTYLPLEELKDDTFTETQYKAIMLFMYRFFTSLSVESLVDIFFSRQGSAEIIDELLKVYLQKGDEKNG